MVRLHCQSPSLTGEPLTTNTPAPEAPPPAPADDTLDLDQLAEMWASHQQRGLEIRFRTGKLLNEQFNAPSTRQARGAEVMKQAAERLRIALSELSRMRNFASLFESLEEFVRQHGTKTWTEVKALLPKLKAKPKHEGGSKPRKDVTRSHKRSCQRIDALTKRLERVEANDLSESQRGELQARLENLAEVARTRLGLAVAVV
jgi:hypothetical protein